MDARQCIHQCQEHNVTIVYASDAVSACLDVLCPVMNNAKDIVRVMRDCFGSGWHIVTVAETAAEAEAMATTVIDACNIWCAQATPVVVPVGW